MTEKIQIGQHIVEITVENFMRLVTANVRPDGKDMIVTGKNFQGKSSFLNALRWALNGTEANKIKEPIRQGEGYTSVVIEFDDITVKRSLTRDGKPQLIISNKEGARFPSPAAMLKKLIGNLAFDPIAFMSKHPKDQLEDLLKMIDTGDVDLSEIDEQRKETFEFRTDINRKVRDTKARRNKYGIPYPGTPDEEISISRLTKDLTDAMAIEEQHRIDQTILKNTTLTIAQKQSQITQLNQDIRVLNVQGIDIEKSISNYEDPNSQAIKDQIEEADEINTRVRYLKEKAHLTQELHEYEAKSKELTNEIEDLDATKRYVIEQADMPVKGLSYDENGITLNDIPLSNCSSMEQIEIAMNIYMKSAPTGDNAINIIFVQDGSLLDDESLEHAAKICADNGFQLILEKVSSKAGSNEIFIEAGEVKE